MITGCCFFFLSLEWWFRPRAFDDRAWWADNCALFLPILWHGVEIPCTFLLLIFDRRNDGEVT
jgi:hypothetical protein